MAASLSTALDVRCRLPPHTSESKHPICFTAPIKLHTQRRRFTISCPASSSPPDVAHTTQQKPSLSDQLLPLSTTTLPDAPTKTPPLSKSKSTWLNPARARPSVLNLQRQRRSEYTYNPKLRELREFAEKLNDCYPSEAAFSAILEEVPHPPNRDNSLLLLNNLRPWQNTLLFFNWIKTQNFFPMETIFYNITMKALRNGNQFGLIEELANEMISNGIDLDNITYSTMITSAKRCILYDKAIEWFERMYKTGVMPDEVSYSAILDVYSKSGRVQEVMSLYERGRANGWKPDAIAFAVLGRTFGEAGDYYGIMYVLDEMKSLEVKPNRILYNTLLRALGRVGKPGLARSLFHEMVESGITPDERTLTTLVRIYGKARWAEDALELWEMMGEKGWPRDYILFNTLLSMCADLGLVEDAERLFEELRGSQYCKPDSWSYASMLNMYSKNGQDVNKAVQLFEEMSERGLELNVMGCTSLLQCFGRAKRLDDLVRVFDASVERGVKPDDRLCGCLLSILAYCEESEDADKVLGCLQQAKPELVAFIKLLQEEKTSFETIKWDFKDILGTTVVDSRRPFCNCLIDICRNRNLNERAHELLYAGTVYGLYPGLHTRTPDEWRLNVRSLSVGAALTALEEWMSTLMAIIERKEALPELFSATVGAGTHKFSQGLGSAFEAHVKKLAAPFRQSAEKAGVFEATREELVKWVKQSRVPSIADAA